MRQTLSATDRLIEKKNLEISELNSRLATANQKISERDTEIENLESDLASSVPTSTPITIELPESADLLNKLKGKRKKSKTDLADIEVLLEILDKQR